MNVSKRESGENSPRMGQRWMLQREDLDVTAGRAHRRRDARTTVQKSLEGDPVAGRDGLVLEKTCGDAKETCFQVEVRPVPL